jgi:hypothetical protein
LVGAPEISAGVGGAAVRVVHQLEAHSYPADAGAALDGQHDGFAVWDLSAGHGADAEDVELVLLVDAAGSAYDVGEAQS